MIIEELLRDIFAISELDEILFSREELHSALKEFTSLVEIDNIKEIIIRQLRFFLVKLLRKESTILNKEFFNTVLYGPPGVGKSKIAKIIAKLWKAIGIFSSTPSNKIILPLSLLKEIKTLFSEVYEHTFLKNKKNADTDKKWNTLKKILNDFSFEEKRISSHLEVDDSIIICGREDFVAEYTGHTSIKTLKFLEENGGKCIIIEEAYTLCYSSTDTFGIEALTLINRWMEERRGENVFIFTGYKNLMLDTIFKFQPGLKRRCRWFFDIKSYSPEALKHIFLSQISELGLVISSDVVEIISTFFEREKEHFPNYGGDTEKFAEECDTSHYSNIAIEEVSNNTLSLKDFEDAFLSFKKFSVET